MGVVPVPRHKLVFVLDRDFRLGAVKGQEPNMLHPGIPKACALQQSVDVYVMHRTPGWFWNLHWKLWPLSGPSGQSPNGPAFLKSVLPWLVISVEASEVTKVPCFSFL